MSSCSFASEAEVNVYPFISDAVLKHCNGFPVLYTSADSAVRIFPIDNELSTFLRREYQGKQGQTSPQFKLYSEGSKDPQKWKSDLTNCFKSGTEVEVDYFAYVDEQQASHAVRELTIDESLRANASAVSKRGSDSGECRKIVVFEISNAPEGLYKIAQLERDLKVIAFRQAKKGVTGNPLDAVALAGVSLKSTVECERIQRYLDDNSFAEYAPRVHDLHQRKKIVVVCHGPQPSNFAPTAVWVLYGTVVFKVSPATNDVDSLKKAVKATWDPSNPGNVMNIFKLIVKDAKGNVLKASAPLQANTEETAYIVE